MSCSFDFWWTLNTVHSVRYWEIHRRAQPSLGLVGIRGRRAAGTPRSGFCVEQGIYMSFWTSSDWAIVMGVTEGVTHKQHLQYHSQLHASEHRLVCTVCSILSKGISNLRFLGFQRVPCVALGSASFISFFLSFSSLLHLEKPQLFSFFFFFLIV